MLYNFELDIALPGRSRVLTLQHVAVSSWSIANNFVIDFYCRCLEILCQIALRSVATYFRSYSLLQFAIKYVGIYRRSL